MTSNDPDWVEELEFDDELQRVLHALAHPVRRYLLSIMVPSDASATDLAASAAAQFGISAGRGSQHLRILADAGLVEVIADGQWRYYRRQSSGADVVRTWLAELVD